MFRRPNLYTSYEAETQVLPTFTKKVIAVFAVVALFLMPFDFPIISGPTEVADPAEHPAHRRRSPVLPVPG